MKKEVFLHLILIQTNNTQQHQQQQQQIQDQQQQIIHLNWLNFQTRIFRKPDEGAKVHLLHSNDWMNTYCFADGVKVQRFSLTLLGEARLWYHPLELINVDCPELKNFNFNEKHRNPWMLMLLKIR